MAENLKTKHYADGSLMIDGTNASDPFSYDKYYFAYNNDESNVAIYGRLYDMFAALNGVNNIAFYIDGADEVSEDYSLIKGGGGAHTREKIVASASDHFICIVDKSKLVKNLGVFALPIEVIPESRSLVSRKILSLGGIPTYRQGFVTDQGNQVIDVTGLNLQNPLDMEYKINGIAGVVDNGIFAINKPKTVLVSD